MPEDETVQGEEHDSHQRRVSLAQFEAAAAFPGLMLEPIAFTPTSVGFKGEIIDEQDSSREPRYLFIKVAEKSPVGGMTLVRPAAHSRAEKLFLQRHASGEGEFAQVISVSEAEDSLVYAMPLYSGASVEQRIHSRGYGLEELRLLILRSFRALRKTELAGRSFGDFHTGSILYDNKDVPYITDLGNIRVPLEELMAMTAGEGVLSAEETRNLKNFDNFSRRFGSEGYKAPETFFSNDYAENDSISDQFSFAETIYNILSQGGFSYQSLETRYKELDDPGVFKTKMAIERRGNSYNFLNNYIDIYINKFGVGENEEDFKKLKKKLQFVDVVLSRALSTDRDFRYPSLSRFTIALLSALRKFTEEDFQALSFIMKRIVYS